MSNKKVIGLTGPSSFTPYVREMVTKFFGAIPLDINQNGEEDVKQVFDLCDAVILAGGSDIYPTNLTSEWIIGEQREFSRANGYTKFDKERDARELELIKFCEETKKPFMGICRGFQMIMAHKGFYLIPDISWSEIVHSPKDIETDGEPIHYVRCLSHAQKEFFEKDMVNSYHHQAIQNCSIKDAANLGVDILGTSNLQYFIKDKQPAHLIIEMARGDGWIGVQWHPEAIFETNKASQIVLDYFKKMVG